MINQKSKNSKTEERNPGTEKKGREIGGRENVKEEGGEIGSFGSNVRRSEWRKRTSWINKQLQVKESSPDRFLGYKPSFSLCFTPNWKKLAEWRRKKKTNLFRRKKKRKNIILEKLSFSRCFFPLIFRSGAFPFCLSPPRRTLWPRPWPSFVMKYFWKRTLKILITAFCCHV